MLFYHFIYQHPIFIGRMDFVASGACCFLIKKGACALLWGIIMFFSNKWQNSNLVGAFRLFLCR